jgi:glutamate-1-semialdehyde 2,1-aminomutase
LTSRILRAAFKHGVSLYSTSYVNYSHKDEDIEETLERMDKAIAEVAASL